jgi:uncharacterized NAD(P)/FAD-binding protein YdhS
MKKLAIIGLGPRGLSALEQILLISNNKVDFEIHLYENSEFLGAGNTWNLDQPDYNWINISERALQNLKGRPQTYFFDLKIPSFPDYKDWVEYNIEEKSKTHDLFPPRKKIGSYLNERFLSIYKVLKTNKNFKIIKNEVTQIDYKDKHIRVTQSNDNSENYDEVVICIGHQPTKDDSQLKKWINHTITSDCYLFKKVYPIKKIAENPNIKTNYNVAIRGFGLAMIDVVRSLTIGNKGSFKYINPQTFQSTYSPSGKEPKHIIPFSLNGFPLAPKPLNSLIDELFKPVPEDFSLLENKLNEVAKGNKQVDSIQFLTTTIANIASKRYILKHKNTLSHQLSESEITKIIMSWFEDEEIKNELIQNHKLPTIEIIQSFVDMAVTGKNLSLDYFVGQIWRHLQPTIYKAFSHAQVSDEIFAETIKLDERIKRYSYGPPVESLQQLIALYQCGILNLEHTNNPDIELHNNGWHLSDKKNEITAEVMVNSILDSPKLLDITSPIVKNLIYNDMVKPVHSELGIDTNKNGLINFPDSKYTIALSILGRLAKGSVIGVDAILECFGDRIRDWAEGVVERNS